MFVVMVMVLSKLAKVQTRLSAMNKVVTTPWPSEGTPAAR
jgi:hypothetical protein